MALGGAGQCPGLFNRLQTQTFRLLPPATMPITRMRMRPWLEMQINSNQIPGLIWINKVSVTGCFCHCFNPCPPGDQSFISGNKESRKIYFPVGAAGQDAQGLTCASCFFLPEEGQSTLLEAQFSASRLPASAEQVRETCSTWDILHGSS